MADARYDPDNIFAKILRGEIPCHRVYEDAHTLAFMDVMPQGEGHTLVAYEHEEPMKVHFKVTGPLIWLDEDGEPDGYFDVHQYIAMCRAHYDKVGIGADYIDRLFR